MENKITWAIYARKSTESEDRQIQSIDDQIKYLREMADREGLYIFQTIKESKSAKAPFKRDGFTELTKLVEQGKINGILTWKMDRLSRNPIDSATIQYFLQEKKILCVKTAEKNYLPEDNALIMSVESGMANQYVRDLSKNVKRGLMSKVEKGWFPNIPPVGYLNSKTKEKGNETIIVDEERFKIVRKMWDLMLTGIYSPPHVLRIATNDWGLRTPIKRRQGGKSISQSEIYNIFSNIFYTGYFSYGGKTYQGKHVPMITIDEYDRVQVMLGKKGKPKMQTHDFPFTGIMKCEECGARITASRKTKLNKTKGTVETYTYYHCTKRRKYIRCTAKPVTVTELENSITKIFEDNMIDSEFYKLGLETLKDMHSLEVGKRQQIYETQLRNVEETQKKLDRALSYLLDGTITQPQYTSQKKELEESLTKEKAKLNETEARAKNWTELTENVLHFSSLAIKALESEDTKIQRDIFNSLGWNHRINAKKLFVDLHSWFIVLKNGEKELLPKIKALELENILDPQRKKEAFASILPTLCRDPGSNWGPFPLQGNALPTELSRHLCSLSFFRQIIKRNTRCLDSI
jgi:site-specific DNA recombinase